MWWNLGRGENLPTHWRRRLGWHLRLGLRLDRRLVWSLSRGRHRRWVLSLGLRLVTGWWLCRHSILGLGLGLRIGLLHLGLSLGWPLGRDR